MTPKPVIIEEYNPEWPKMFQEIQAILALTLGTDALSIEHVGSTSVPGLAAKPILDIDVVIESMKSLPAVIAKLETLGYNHQGDLGVEGREAFDRKDEYVPYSEEISLKMTQHLYVCHRDCQELYRHITFRDTLINNPELVQEYASSKKELAIIFRNDRKAYTEGKSDFVQRVLKQVAR
ncbi:GrpB family protein [Paenibacillus sp. MDMC362]|uniref:GrpB family protein n=1 Tax=Paenibacillus sp. MDMC362 TaxID=2977365 RepID=UPI000DC4D678|nr:GrpB family protein [Paenibacillus sp. MDMC362]RAR45867.1 GrpB family protein [Paenibacillus sp. MDMC362]